MSRLVSRAKTAFPSTLVFLLLPGAVFGTDWEPIPREHLQLTSSKMDPGADAEALLWNVEVEDAIEGGKVTTTLRHHLQVKIFNERGRDQNGRLDLPYLPQRRIVDIQGRTVLPDGREIRLESKDIFDRTIIKANNLKVKAKSFAFPGAEPGAVLECRWRELRVSNTGLSSSYPLQRDIPVRRVTYRLRPLAVSSELMFTTFNALMPPFERDPNGYLVSSLANVPALREEPDMPPEHELRPYFWIYYSSGTADVATFWRDFGRNLYDLSREDFAAGKELRQTALEVVGQGQSDEEKLRALYDFCRREIRNLVDDATEGAGEAKRSVDVPKNLRQVLSRREGTSLQIDLLFGSLAASLGYVVRLSRLADREISTFSREARNAGLLTSYCVAVRLGDGWRFFDPGTRLLPFGMLRWQEEGQEAIVPDPKEPLWVRTPATGAEFSGVRRVGTFRLREDGTLEGQGGYEYVGHEGIRQKELVDHLSANEREKQLVESVHALLPTAELTDVSFENADGVELPYRVSFALRVPGYAQITGKRLFFKPAVFVAGRQARFTAASREHPIDFHFPWSETDSLVIGLPEGYEFENPEAPSNHEIGQFGGYQVRMGVGNEGRVLVYRRAFRLGRARFSPDDYGALKSDFEVVHERDQHTMAIRRTDAGGR